MDEAHVKMSICNSNIASLFIFCELVFGFIFIDALLSQYYIKCVSILRQ